MHHNSENFHPQYSRMKKVIESDRSNSIARLVEWKKYTEGEFFRKNVYNIQFIIQFEEVFNSVSKNIYFSPTFREEIVRNLNFFNFEPCHKNSSCVKSCIIYSVLTKKIRLLCLKFSFFWSIYLALWSLWKLFWALSIFSLIVHIVLPGGLIKLLNKLYIHFYFWFV